MKYKDEKIDPFKEEDEEEESGLFSKDENGNIIRTVKVRWP